ncbi:MAG: S9 family peptidase, partial [Balneolales bacterium]
AWEADNQTIFYTRQDAQTLRSNQVFRHRLGDDTAGNKLVYQEDDDTFRTYVMRTKSRGYISIVSSSTVSTEYRVIPAGEPTADARVIQPRQRDLLYYADHFGDYFYIRTNDQAENFRLMRAPVNRPDIGNWEEVIAHREDVLLEGIDIFRDFLVLSERKEGLMQIRTRNWESGEEHYLDFDEPAYYAYTTTNPSFETGTLRYAYTSLTTPASTYDYDMAGRTSILLKESEVLGGFNREHYVTERHMATAKDGTAIPVSLVYRKGLKRDGSNPLLQYAYGSYGYSMDPSFSSTRLSLLDRGFVYAIAHIRGGQEMGRHWYDQGKLKHKMNTFTDFIDVSEYLIGEDFTSTENLYAMGGSAGGLLMGAIVNMRPDLYKGVIAAVPFVDVVTTMLDDSIPLTTSEYDEWGNPNDPEYYDVMMAYSPYDNVKPQDYPNMLVTSGLHDSQVQYWEPTKWVSKLRDLKTDDNVLLLHTNMDAGHGGASGRFQRLREVALQYAFLLELSGRGRDARK